MPIEPRLQAALDAPHGAGRDLIQTIRQKRGYAAPSGSGPAGETCQTCRNIGGVKGNEYASCCRIAKKGSFGVAIYISPTAEACRSWEPRG